MEKPSLSHWAAVKQILRYIQGTLSYGCCYRKGSGIAELVGFSDNDHAGDLDGRKSTTGMTFFLGKNLITWSLQYSCEAELHHL
jgi:hypothetical protein